MLQSLRTLASLFVLILTLSMQDMTIDPITTGNDPGDVLGYGFLAKIVGLWHGPVKTDTPAGSFPEWYVDFRPISAGEVAQFSLLDAQTINNLNFFIVKHDGQLKVAMRTEGCFNEACCVTYEVIDKVDEEAGYYRFSDFQRGAERAYTEFTFMDDEFLMEVYTNKFNTKEKLELHSRWEAKLGGREAASEAISALNFPQPVMIKDFSDVFINMTESIYYTFENDPYSSSSQPYVGSVTVDIKISEDLKLEKSHELFLLLTTESLFNGLKYIKDSDKYYSKYVYLPVSTMSYTIKNVHPGKYYLYGYPFSGGIYIRDTSLWHLASVTLDFCSEF